MICILIKNIFLAINIKKKKFNSSDFLIGKKIEYYFQSDLIRAISDEFKNVRQTYLNQVQYEIQRQHIFDRFCLKVKHEKYEESFMFFISQHDYPKNLYINNLEIFNHFRFYFLDKAHQLIQKAENNILIKPYRQDRSIEMDQTTSIKKIINKMDIRHYYIFDKETYLTKQQMFCAAYMMHSYSAKQIAKALNLSPRTVENHIEIIKRKFNFQERSELIKELFSAFPSFSILLK